MRPRSWPVALPAQKDAKALDDMIDNIIANAGGVLPEAQG